VDAAASQVAAENKVAVQVAAAVKKVVVAVNRPAAVVVRVVAAVAVVVQAAEAAAIAKLTSDKGEFKKDSPLPCVLASSGVAKEGHPSILLQTSCRAAR
jgi:hypothetical protein